jgi:hypothetical protein
VLYDVIERQRLEAGILDCIDMLMQRCPSELRGYLSVPVLRRRGRTRRPLCVTLMTTSSGWFVTADRFYTRYDTGWLAKLEMSELRTCLRFLSTGRDLGLGWSIDAALRRASELKHESQASLW